MVTILYTNMASIPVGFGFGAWLRVERERRGLTALAIADKAGYSHVTIHNIEHGKKGVKRPTVEAIAAALAGDNASKSDRQRLKNDALLAAGFAPEDAELTSEIAEEEAELLHLFRGPETPNTPAQKRKLLELIRMGVALTGDESESELSSG